MWSGATRKNRHSRNSFRRASDDPIGPAGLAIISRPARPDHGISYSLERTTQPEIGTSDRSPDPLHPEALVPALAFMPSLLEPAAVFILGRPVATCIRLHPIFDR